jgi:hypothetical protein
MELELLVTHESGACSSASFVLDERAAAATHVLRRRATRRAVVCWSLAARSGPCVVPLVRCARPFVHTPVARVDTRPLRIHLALSPTRTRTLERMLERAARVATAIACAGRLPPELLDRIARLVFTARRPRCRVSSPKRPRGASPRN